MQSDSNPLVSIVVPVYNSEKYLRMMVNSILNQSYTNFELLLIDDGSKDASVGIVDEYASKDTRVHAIHKSNGGVSSARNTGIDNAKGEFVVFWDNDDYVYSDYLFTMLQEVENHDLLITHPVQCRYLEPFSPPVRNRSNQCVAKAQLEDMYKVFPIIDSSEIAWVWAQLFRRDILVKNNVRFEQINSEDTMFSYQYLRYVKSVKIIDYAGYCYIHREGSLSSSHKYVAEANWIQKRYLLYQDIWKNFNIDINQNVSYRNAVADRFAIRLSAFLLKGYHEDTRVSRDERLKRWKSVKNSKVLNLVNKGGVNRKCYLFLSLTKGNLYVLADFLLRVVVK